jgi:2-polyprenyl-3-methyl-5-hydroxy-6-metoxy-1,4-benzoquinol methylase
MINLPFSSEEYDRGWTDLWDDMKQYGPFARHLRRIVFSLIEPLTITSVLDVSCGQGKFLLELLEKFPSMQIYGTEYSSKAVDLVRKRIPIGHFEQLDISKTVLPGEFDLVVCLDVLEHIEDDRTAIKNLSTMTRHYLLVSSIQGRMRRLELSYGHVRNYEPRELMNKLTTAGLNIIKVVEWGFPFFSPLYRDLMNTAQGRGTTGKYGLLQKTIAKIIYIIFMMNSWRKGDEIIILAELKER